MYQQPENENVLEAAASVVAHWKKFHDDIGTVLGCKVREVNATLAAAKQMVHERQKIVELVDDLDKSGDEIIAEIRYVLNL